MPRANRKAMTSRAARATPAEPPVDLLARAVEAARVLALIGTPEAVAAIGELAAAGQHLAAAFDQAGTVVMAALPTSITSH